MRISVVIPVYNTGKYLRECLDSVVGQTFRDLDIIVVDDGSTDGSSAICDEYAARDSRIRVLHCSNGGLSVARNRGIDLADGEFISFIDSDDAIHPSMIQCLLDAALAASADIASCACRRGTELRYEIKGGGQARISASEKSIEKMLYQTSLATSSACAHLFKRSLFDDVRFTPGILYEDLDAVPFVFEKAVRVVSLPDKLYFYRITPNSLINTWSPRRLDVLSVTARLEAHFKSHPRIYAAACDRRLSAAFNIFMLNARQRSQADEEVALRCWHIIRERRMASLLNPRVRLKNKAGIMVSYLGRRISTFAVRLTQ